MSCLLKCPLSFCPYVHLFFSHLSICPVLYARRSWVRIPGSTTSFLLMSLGLFDQVSISPIVQLFFSHLSNCSLVHLFICPVVHPSFCHFVNLSFLPSCLFGCLSSPFVTCLPNEKVLRSQAINMYFFKHSQNVLHKAKLGCK